MNRARPLIPAVVLFDGHSKREVATFQLTLQSLGVPAGQVLFVDDNAAHIGRAAVLGLQVHHFGDEGGFAAELVRRRLWSDQSDRSDRSDPFYQETGAP